MAFCVVMGEGVRDLTVQTADAVPDKSTESGLDMQI